MIRDDAVITAAAKIHHHHNETAAIATLKQNCNSMNNIFVLVCVADAKRSRGVPDCKVLGLGLDLGYRLGQTRSPPEGVTAVPLRARKHDETLTPHLLMSRVHPLLKPFFCTSTYLATTAVPPSGTTKSHACVRGNYRPSLCLGNPPNRWAGVRASLPLSGVLGSVFVCLLFLGCFHSTGTTISINDCLSWI
jgi:hypothetical protein